MTRREAIKKTMIGASALAILPACVNTSNKEEIAKTMETNRNYGIQLFTIPQMVDKDMKGTLKLLSEIGYKEIEFFGPYPFSHEETIKSWEALKGQLGLENNAFYGYTVKETAQMLKDFGLTTPSMHADLISMQKDMTKMLDGVSELSPKYLVIPAIMDGRDTLDDYKRLAEEFNSFGEAMAKYDMKFVYHNHGYEHAEKEGVIPMDYLIKNTDPNYVQFELDIFWMSAAGADPLAYLQKYPDRYKMLHIKDAKEPFRFSGDGSTPDQWMGGFPLMSDPGDGVLGVKEIIVQAAKGAVDHYFLERDLAPQPEETLRNSFDNLSKM